MYKWVEIYIENIPLRIKLSSRRYSDDDDDDAVDNDHGDRSEDIDNCWI